MARPRKAEHEKRDAQLPPVRVTQAELAHAEALASAAGLTLSDFVRQRALKGQVSPALPVADASLITEVNRVSVALNRVGTNVNQLALASHMDERIDRDFTRDWRFVMSELRAIQEEARSLLSELAGRYGS